MKKALLAVLVALFISPAAFADNWGATVKLGMGENDPKTLNDGFNNGLASKDLTEGDEFFGLEGLYEHNLTDNDKVGVRLGIDFYGENELETRSQIENLKEDGTENTYAIPLTVYYKRDNGIKNWSFFAGAGITYIHSELEYEAEDLMGIDKEEFTLSKSKVFPHVMAGAEYRFSQLFALGLEAKYNFSAKTEKDYEGLNVVVSDRSGLSGAVTARFYF